MSYTIAPTFEGNRLGIRRLRTLSGIGGEVSTLGDAGQDVLVQQLTAAGKDPGLVQTVIAMGATNTDLANLLNGTADIGGLMNTLSNTQSVNSPTNPQNPINQATISTAFGLYDLSQQAAWDSINSLFSSTQQNLTALARQAPNDPTVTTYVTQFNGLVQQWAGYYNQAFGSNPSPMPTITLSGLGVAPLVVVGLAALVATLLYALYVLNQNISAKKAALATQSGLVTQYQAAVASGNTAAATQLLAAISATNTDGSGAASFTAWMSKNWAFVAAGSLAFILVGIVGEKKL